MGLKNDNGKWWTEELGGILIAKNIQDKTSIHSLVGESVQERAIEMGMGFMTTHTVSIATSDSEYFQITTPSDKNIALYNLLITAGQAILSRFEIYEAATTSGSSTANTWTVNINRFSTTTATYTTVSAPTVTDEGTKLMEIYTGLSGYIVTGNPSIQLKNDTKYLIKLYNDHIDTVNFNIFFQAFELPID